MELLLEDDITYDFTDAGRRGMVVKTWYTPSASRNALVQKLADRDAEEPGSGPSSARIFDSNTII